ncbi:S41 family peptidase [Sphingobacterium detergens]|uniref:Peptidase S41-like protein n=1 Tax=Sphingobacterium detergens TaxID=1145106 RepID=A0A420ADJ0_SPHD1|nr:S41 family peptidase [Sphingobacterium detergens]RKE42578.1 peptidase S41-like protein [Sphingobacterium detergens]
MKQANIGIVILLVIFLMQSCNKKNDDIPQISKEQKRIIENLDSIFFLAQGVYLWNDQLPSVDRFNPSRFYNQGLNEFRCYENGLFEITQFAKDAATGELYERNIFDLNRPKYSGIVFREFQESERRHAYNVSNTFGLSVVVKNNILRLLYVDPNSPAGKAGLRRGTQILSINGENVLTEESFLDQWKKSLAMSFIKLEVMEEGIKKREVRLNAASYEINPVVKRNILRSGERTIGYFALNSFTTIQNAQKYLTPIFLSFTQEKINELIIDLRYNQGGYQITADFIANLVAPNNADAKIMYTEHYNRQMQDGNSKVLENYKLYDEYHRPVIINGKEISLYDIDYSVEANTTYFHKDDGLTDLKKVYFIVSNRTASASELLINILKPYMDVQVIGVSEDNLSAVYTYGKPVGSFGIPVGQFDLYLGMYELKNTNRESNYFKGIKSDVALSDDTDTDFGGQDDPAIAWILGMENKRMELKTGNKIRQDKYSFYFNTDRLIGNIKNNNELKIKIK